MWEQLTGFNHGFGQNEQSRKSQKSTRVGIMMQIANRDEDLSGLQRKKGAMVFSAMDEDLDDNTEVAYRVVTGYEDKIIHETVYTEDEQGNVERNRIPRTIQVEKTEFKFGKIVGMAPTIDKSRGIRGSGYEIQTPDGVVTVPKVYVMTREMHDHIKYRPTLLMVYIKGQPVIVVMHTWDSIFLFCPLTNRFIPGLLDDSFIEAVKNQKGYTVRDNALTVSINDTDGNAHTFGPMECSLFKNSDCRGCVARLLNFSEGNWDRLRQVTREITGRGTMYLTDEKFLIRKQVGRDLYIKFIEFEKWAQVRNLNYILHLLRALYDFKELHNVEVPKVQLELLEKNIAQKVKEETKAYKKLDESTISEHKDLIKEVKSALKDLKMGEAKEETQAEESAE